MMYEIYHKTAFEYESMVTFSHNIARLKPRENRFQKILDFSMEIIPHVYEEHSFEDMFGNSNTHLLIRKPHRSLSVIGRSRVEVFPHMLEAHNERMKLGSMPYEKALELLSAFDIHDLLAKKYGFESELISKGSSAIKAYALESFHPKRDLYAAGEEFMERIFRDFEFVPGFSDVTTPIEEIFEAKKGVCQDFTHFAIASLRAIGLPAKYISGYIETLPKEGEAKLFGVDASHAWFALYIPRSGWMGFDPTNNLIPTSQHIFLGQGRDYDDITPLKGVVMSSGKSELQIGVDVKRISD
jgi:transglutaminase-like putative cysteine protease